jgi:uncharacterized membrane protein YdjX (TVP38/TMEM64 family)
MTPRPQRRHYAKVGAVLVVIVTLAIAYRLGVFTRVADPKTVARTLVEMGPWGYLAFVAAYAVLQPFGVPGTVFVVAAPLIWPWQTAFVLSMTGTMSASVIGFSFARFVAKDWISTRIPARLRKYDEALERNAFQTVVLLRLIFWMPQPLHAFFGVSKVRFWTHFWGSLVGYFPPLLLVSYLGAEMFDAAAARVADSRRPARRFPAGHRIDASLRAPSRSSSLQHMEQLMAYDLEGRVILVTGATDGIGKAAAMNFAKRGATLTVVGRNPAKTAQVLAELKAVSGNENLDLLVCDLSRMTDVRRAAEQFKSKHERLDVLVNNAGASKPCAKTPEQGADSLVWLATSKEAASLKGQYVSNRRPVSPSKRANDAKLATDLWTLSERLCAEVAARAA